MKKLIIILVLVFAANVVKAQTETTPKIHLWVTEGDSDYIIPSNIWGKLKDSRIYNKLGTYIYSFKWEIEVEYDYIIYISSMYLQNLNGNTTTMGLYQIRNLNGSKELIYRKSLVTTNISDEHISQSVENCYKQVLIWYDEYMK